MTVCIIRNGAHKIRMNWHALLPIALYMARQSLCFFKGGAAHIADDHPDQSFVILHKNLSKNFYKKCYSPSKRCFLRHYAHFTRAKHFSEKVAFFAQICYHYPSAAENSSFACHQKKVLALVLAFACAFTMFAGAAFTDAADIKNADAVDMLTALGVIDGYDDGSFKPDATVTRAEAAKMIFTIRNGGNDNADAFTGGKTTFTDVYAGYWAEGYIKYCQSMGIISGKSTTKFVPEGTVTGAELAKMLLVTLGYDPKTAGLEGAGWDQKTIGLASENGLLDDVTASLSAACPRQYAAQIMYNAINADIVTLKDGKYQKVETTTTEIVNAAEEGEDPQYVAVTVTKNKTLGKEYMDLNESSAIPMLEMSKNDKGEYSFATFTKIDKDYSELMGQNVKVGQRTRTRVGRFPAPW